MCRCPLWVVCHVFVPNYFCLLFWYLSRTSLLSSPFFLRHLVNIESKFGLGSIQKKKKIHRLRNIWTQFYWLFWQNTIYRNLSAFASFKWNEMVVAISMWAFNTFHIGPPSPIWCGITEKLLSYAAKGDRKWERRCAQATRWSKQIKQKSNQNIISIAKEATKT